MKSSINYQEGDQERKDDHVPDLLQMSIFPSLRHVEGEDNFTVTGYRICPHTLSVVRRHSHLPGAGDRQGDPVLQPSLCQEELDKVMVSLSPDIPVLRKQRRLENL